ncbi:MAG: cysteine hydrolase [Ruminococcus sp.]|nr:cysteine hydrolase [Ruminococcus sp.]
MRNFLVVVDMQKDFVDGSLGTLEAQAIVGNVVKKIESFQGEIFVTYDTHFEDYLETSEGKKLPVEHCIKESEGWELDKKVAEALSGKNYTKVEKLTFGSVDLPKLIKDRAGNEDFTVELVGLCTDICVVSNALVLKANFPEKKITVDASCCAGVTLETHNHALSVMRMCQIDIIGE